MEKLRGNQNTAKKKKSNGNSSLRKVKSFPGYSQFMALWVPLKRVRCLGPQGESSLCHTHISRDIPRRTVGAPVQAGRVGVWWAEGSVSFFSSRKPLHSKGISRKGVAFPIRISAWTYKSPLSK